MKVFRIGSSGWEIYGEHILIHSNKSKEEFNKDCKKVIIEIISELIDEIDKDNNKIFLNAYTLLNESISKLEELGYEHLEFDGDYEVPGNDCSYISDEESQESLKKEFGDELIDKFIKKAKKIEIKKYS